MSVLLEKLILTFVTLIGAAISVAAVGLAIDNEPLMRISLWCVFGNFISILIILLIGLLTGAIPIC